MQTKSRFATVFLADLMVLSIGHPTFFVVFLPFWVQRKPFDQIDVILLTNSSTSLDIGFDFYGSNDLYQHFDLL